MAYNKPWQVQAATSSFGSNEIGTIIEHIAQDNRDPLEILISEEEDKLEAENELNFD